MGPTSYSDVLTEGLGALEDLPITPSSSSTSEPITISAARLADGCRALEFLSDKRLVDGFVKHWIDMDEVALSYPRPAMRIWLSELWTVHGDVLGGRLVAPRRTLCETIWRNTFSCIPYNKDTTLQEWSHCATGKGLRWEVVGLIAVTYAFYIASPHASHHNLLENGLVQSKATADLVRVAEACISFCHEAGGAFGDIFVWLVYDHSRLLRAVASSRSFRTYNALGESVSAVLTLGIHKAPAKKGPSSRLPLFLLETRRRAFLSTYAAEISMALFLGRPPRISSSYCDMQAPLELTDDELALPRAALEETIQNIHDGHKTQKSIHYILWLQAWARIGPHREEVLDLALRNHEQNDLVERARVIEERMRDDWLSMPDCVRAPIDSTDSMRQLGLVDALWTTMLKIDYTTNNLVLQRVVLQKTGSSAAKLISAAQEILNDIKHIAQSHQIAHAAQTDYICFLIHGLSSASILAVELLKQEQSSTYPAEPLLPRSRTIQDLAEFVATLKSVDRSNAAYPMCEQSHQAISHILDKILSHRPGESRPVPTTAQAHDERSAMDGQDITALDGTGDFGFAGNLGLDDDFLMPMTEDPVDWLTYLNTGATEY